MKVNLLTVLFLTLFCLTALAQEYDVELTSKWVGSNAVISAQKHSYGAYTVLLKFDVLENCSLNSAHVHVFTVRSNTDLIMLKPFLENSRLNFRYTYRYIPGIINPKLNDRQLYRIPLSAARDVRVRYLSNIHEEYFGKPTSGTWKALQFIGQQGDTLYAMRKGEVIEIINKHDKPNHSTSYTSQNNSIKVQHADGTLARYSILAKDSFMVREGDVVYPDTPLALISTLDDEVFETRVMVFYPIRNINAAKIEDSFSWTYIDPLFATSEGAAKLDNNKSYQPIVTHDLLTSEMSKKELKKRNMN